MDHLLQLIQQLKNPTRTSPPPPTKFKEEDNLTYNNYIKWYRLMSLSLEGQGRLSHITTPPPASTDPTYPQWKQQDYIVLSWLITNTRSDLVNQFIDYTIAWDLRKGLETLLNSGGDELQIFDLSTKVASLKQNHDSLEVFYGNLQTLWRVIDRRMPNPMKHAEDITIYNNIVQKQRLFQFLTGINDTLDKERRDILNLDPLPTLDKAIAIIRREISRRGIMSSRSSSEPSSSEIGNGPVVRNRSDYSSFRRDPTDKTHLIRDHRGGSRHTKEWCFKLIGYPDWWEH